MAKDMVSYSKIKEIANMSLDEYKSAYGNGGGLFGIGAKSDEELQAIIDRYHDAVNRKNEYATTWDSLVQEAEDNYNDMYEHSLKYLEMNSGITDEQWEEAYNSSVSDNYATGSVSGLDFENVEITSGDDNVPIDWSEMQTMKKTQLSDGHFVRYAPSDYFDDSAQIGDSRDICGGTITYLGKKSVTYDRGEFSKDGLFYVNHWGAASYSNLGPILDQRTNMVHYEGVLGSFDYDANEWSLGYWEAEVNGNKVRVPILHYNNDGKSENLLHMTFDGFVDGEKIKIPEGLKSLDYTFADTGIKTMPKIPNSVESAHCAFMDCTELERGSASSKIGSGVDEGKLLMPENLKDMSWMFAGCTHMQDYFADLGKNVVDGRYAFSECKSLGWDGQTIEDGKMVTSFKMPDISRLRNANPFWLQNMFDNCDDAVINKINDYVSDHGDFTSEWTDEDGNHHKTYDKLVDGSYDTSLEQDISSETSRGKILQLIDKDSKGLTGVSSDTAGLATTGVQITDSGTFADNSLWAKFRQSDFEATFDKGNEFGTILNHAIPAVGTYAISKSVLNSMLDGKHKLASTIGAVAVAAIPQVVGYGNTLTPVLDWTANAVGPETKAGKFLTEFSNKLKGAVTYQTAVNELNADETFETFQKSAKNYAENQVARLMTSENYEGEDIVIATKFDVSSDMRSNGKLLGSDANLLFIACEPEENLKNTLSDSIMKTSLEAINDKMDLELQGAGEDTEKISEIREKYSGYYMTMMHNIDAYDNAAKQELENRYAVDGELKAQATNGLEKVMRCTTQPLYESLYNLNKEWEDKYGEPFLTDKQLNDNELSTRTMDITGIGTFNDYDPEKDYADHSDIYVEKLASQQQALVNAIADATSQEEINTAYAAYYESAYGWALDEAEAHGVVLDKRGALTSSEKESFARYVEQVEQDQIASIESTESEAETDSASEITDTASVSESESESDRKHDIAVSELGLDDTEDNSALIKDAQSFMDNLSTLASMSL